VTFESLHRLADLERTQTNEAGGWISTSHLPASSISIKLEGAGEILVIGGTRDSNFKPEESSGFSLTRRLVSLSLVGYLICTEWK
jgi:hypothetical protein